MPEGKETPASKPVQEISPHILASLGITVEDMERILQEDLQKAGGNTYNTLKDAKERISQMEVDVPEIGVLPKGSVKKVEELPDVVMETWEVSKHLHDEDHNKRALSHVDAWLGGFFNVAFGNGDWRSGINAADVTTDGGIINDNIVMGELKKIAAKDKREGVQIARHIQERIDRRPPPSASILSPVGPSPKLPTESAVAPPTT